MPQQRRISKRRTQRRGQSGGGCGCVEDARVRSIARPAQGGGAKKGILQTLFPMFYRDDDQDQQVGGPKTAPRPRPDLVPRGAGQRPGLSFGRQRQH
jgi:hypothetical protein